MSNIPNNPFEIKSPFRVPWYKDKSYLMLSALTVCTAGALWLMTNVRNDPDLIGMLASENLNSLNAQRRLSLGSVVLTPSIYT